MTTKTVSLNGPTSEDLYAAWSGEWITLPTAQSFRNQRLTIAEAIPASFAGCVLLPNSTETKWFRTVAKRGSAACFVAGRLRNLGTPGYQPCQGHIILF